MVEPGSPQSPSKSQLTPGQAAAAVDPAQVRELRESLAEGRGVEGTVGPENELELWGVRLLEEADPRSGVILAKFIVARGSPETALAMVRKTMEWRKDYGADRLLTEDLPPELDNLCHISGVDKAGHPVMYYVYGPLNDQKVWDKAFFKVDGPLLRSRVRELERAALMLDFTPPPGPIGVTLVHDLAGAPLTSILVTKAAQDAVAHLLLTLNAYYPDMSARHIFIHVPSVLAKAMSILGYSLTDRTRGKFVFAPVGYELDTLCEHIPVEQLPQSYGGFLGMPGGGKGSRVHISAGRSAQGELPGVQAGEEVNWCASVGYGDIACAAVWVDSKGVETEVWAMSVVAVEGSQTGTFKAPESGSMQLRFDNRSSWVYSKSVYYRLSASKGGQ